MIAIDFHDWLIFAGGGLASGILAGLLGLGGGTILVPLLVTLGYAPVQAVATSSLTILITSISGSVQNWRMGYLDFKRVIYLAIPALATGQIGVFLASRLAPYLILLTFGILLLSNIRLIELRQRLAAQGTETQALPYNPVLSRLVTGSAAGLLAGFTGLGGGVIMVPLQMLLLKEPIKVAIQTSLGVIVLTAISICFGHALAGNILLFEGIVLGMGGILGAQISTRALPKLPDRIVGRIFKLFLAILAGYVFAQAGDQLLQALRSR